MRWRIYSSNKVSLHLTISFSISASQFPKFSRTHISSIIMRFEWIHVIPGWSFDSRYTLMATPRHRLLRIFRRHIGRTEKWFAPQAQCEHFEWKLLGSHDRFGNGSIRTFCQNSNRTQNLIEFQLTWKKLNRIVPRKMWPKITLWMHKISFFFFFSIFRFHTFPPKVLYFDYRIPDGSPGSKFNRLHVSSVVVRNGMSFFAFAVNSQLVHIKQMRVRSLFVIMQVGAYTTNMPPTSHNKATIHMETNEIRTRVHAIIFPVYFVMWSPLFTDIYIYSH